jgi:hypothetical protein
MPQKRQRPTGIFTYLTNLQSMHTRILPAKQHISRQTCDSAQTRLRPRPNLK